MSNIFPLFVSSKFYALLKRLHLSLLHMPFFSISSSLSRRFNNSELSKKITKPVFILFSYSSSFQGLDQIQKESRLPASIRSTPKINSLVND